MWGMTLANFVLIAIASFRLTRLIVFDKITEKLRAPFFDEVSEQQENGTVQVYLVPKPKGIRKFLGELLACYWCAGVWMSALLLALYKWVPTIGEPLVLLLAVAGLASIIEVLVSKWFYHY